MKKIILSVAVIAALVLASCKNTNKTKKSNEATEKNEVVNLTDSNFGVRGNCKMCKKTIEKAAKSVAGVYSANWDVEKKKIDVSFDNSKTDILAIHQAIAASGYDTDKVNSDLKAYDDLPACCQYDNEMEMNRSNEGDL